ncbi:MAG: TonB-dependent receptor [Myxococcota bacterium]|jgi:iron complex outermembrane receptor protein|nr:TonB-dependent receptor [Myxococcota bacterium]
MISSILSSLFLPKRFLFRDLSFIFVIGWLCAVVPSIAVATDEEHAHEHDHDHGHGHQHGDKEVIVVTASPLAHEAEELALPVDRLDRDEIVEQLGTTLGDTLRNVPGVANTGFSGGASRPVIRGQDAFRTEVLESGLSTQDASRLSPDHGIPVNPLSAQHVEVVRGPGVLRYGGGASAGVVNAITNRVPVTPVGEALEGEVLGIFGQNAEERDLSTRLTGDLSVEGEGDVVWHFDGLLRESEVYNTGSHGDQPGTQVDAFSASGGASWINDEGRVGVAYTRFENRYGIPEEDEPVLINMKTDRVRLEADWHEPGAGVRDLTFRGVYSDYSHDEIADGAVGQTFHNREFDGRVELLHEEKFGFLGALGLHGRVQDLEAGGEAAEFLAPSETGSLGFYLFEERPLTDHVDLELAFRAEGVWVEGSPRERKERRESFVPLSGSAALVIHPWETWNFGVTGIVGQRAPSQVELFAQGPHEATATFELGDEDLDEETSITGELRIDGVVDRFDIETALFITRYEDFIFGEFTGRTVDEDGDPAGDELDELAYDARDALFWGAEVQVAAELLEAFGGMFGTEWQFDYVRARFVNESGNKNVPRVTPIRWGGKLRYDHERVNGYVGFLRTERQRKGAANEFETKSYTMLELGLRYRPPVVEAIVPIEIGMTARNLLNQNARNPVAFNKEDVRLPGRSFLFSVHARF